jgi:hypothetical protein
VTPTDDLSDEIHDAFNDVLKQVGERSFNQQRRAYEAWLAKYIPRLEAHERTERALGMRRLVAQTLLAEAAIAKRPVNIFEHLLHDMEALGWESLEQKVLATGGMCQYFSDRMWNKVGLRYLLPLRKEVEQEYARTREKIWVGYLRMLGRIEQRLRSRRKPS